nr:MAG TPA: tail fiber protein [Caudoviricetes sp.]
MASTIIIYTGDGTRTDFTIPFDYLKKSFVTVRLGTATTLTGGDYGDTGSDYYFLDKTTIRLKVAPASGESLTIRRHTSATERVATFKDASILKATDLETSQLQAFHIAEEGRDAINDAIIGDKEGNWDAKGHRIINVGTPIKDNDAVNLEYYKKDVEGAYQARLNAEKARDAAKVSEIKATQEADRAKGYAEQATAGQVPADWNQTDSTQKDYIKNKPTIPTKTSQLTNDSGFLISSDIEANYVKTTAQSLTTAQKAQVRTNIGAMSSTDNVASSTGTSVYDAGDFDGRSIGELKKELKNFIYASDGTATNKVFVFYADESFITCWNNDSGTLKAGPTWEVTITCYRAPLQRATLLFTAHIMAGFVLGTLENGVFLELLPISCKKWGGSLKLTSAVLSNTWTNGTSWYRRYSDGWIEQGGEFTKNRDTNITVTFPVAFKDTNYTIATSQYDLHTVNAPVCAFTSKTNTGIIHNIGSWGSKWGWFACGY